VLVGDSIHNFCDGIIIAAAFLADPATGLVTALAIIAHEIPQEVGDYIVLLNAGFSARKALLYNALSGLAAVVGGVLGYFVVGPWQALFPYLLVVASSSFIYVAVADLMPQLQRRLPVHRRRADEAGDEAVGRAVVELQRRADLLDAAVVHHDDAVGHGHGLDLVVRDVDRGGLQPLVQLP
jgi:zinc and cadmium transporter